MKAGKWARKDFMGEEVYGRTLAVLGLGRIGSEVAVRLQAFGMKVIGFDPMVTKEQAEAKNIELLSLEQIWPQADYITVHVPLIKQTENLINKETLAKCKKGVRIINVARGGIVNEVDLVESLNAGHAKGAAFDVFEQEPPTFRELIDHPLVIATPHLGASTIDAQLRVASEIADNIVQYNKGTMLGVLNAREVLN
ncbi:D-3-phosphoglycerate dehydrogenase [Caenorhabditis elegans]|nr:D-3-phosphoglycerate dehydrogenase [Caenorhabditis elegans]CAI9643731.1 D-3-phosphoglycerate dehydrogenase [Caenorhabditis elegans]